jgi:hypothetical protein
MLSGYDLLMEEESNRFASINNRLTDDEYEATVTQPYSNGPVIKKEPTVKSCRPL